MIASFGTGLTFDFIESWHDHPRLIQAFTEKLKAGLAKARKQAGRDVPIIFTAHSVPSRTILEGDPYEVQARRTAELVAKAALLEESDWRFAFQSQGMSGDAWLGPTVETTIMDLKYSGYSGVFLQPIGFLCDHVEVLYDIDVVFKKFAEDQGMRLWRAESLNDSPLLTAALAERFGTAEDRHYTADGFYIAAAAAAACPPLLIADLGRPERFHHMLRIFKPLSPMNLGAWVLAAFAPTAVVRAGRHAADSGRLSRPLAAIARLAPRRITEIAGSLLGFALAGYTGVLLAATNVPLWAKSKLLGGLFMASALSSGSAGISLAADWARSTARRPSVKSRCSPATLASRDEPPSRWSVGGSRQRFGAAPPPVPSCRCCCTEPPLPARAKHCAG